jgi:hypothetical protein
MPSVPATPLFMKDAKLTLKIGAATAAEYQCHVTEARVQVTPGDRIDIATLCSSGSFSEVGKSSYSLILAGVQDWHDGTDQGLSRYLWEHEGEVAAFTLQAHGESTTPAEAVPEMTGNVRLVAGDYGGVINEYASLEVELPCTAKPVLNPAAALLAAAEAEPEPELVAA